MMMVVIKMRMAGHVTPETDLDAWDWGNLMFLSYRETKIERCLCFWSSRLELSKTAREENGNVL